MDHARTRYVVVGLGASGLATARFLRAQGATVFGNDKRSAEALGEGARALEALGVALRLGHHDDAAFEGADCIVLSPGVPPLAAVDRAEARGVRVLGEAELALAHVRGRVVGITGTNGKSTVTTLLGEVAQASGAPTFVGGNLGTPLVEVVGTAAAGEDGLVVVELSSFQLERARDLRCHVAVLLNVTDDHLDRYGDFASYAAAKGRIFAAQRDGDVAIVPDGDALCLGLAQAGKGAVRTFGGEAGLVRHERGHLVDSRGTLALPVRELGIKGLHNVDNAAATLVAARALGIPDDLTLGVLRRFAGLPHRMAHVRSRAGVDWFDDSKATNVGATVAAMDGLADRDGRVVLVLGGVDKGGSYEPVVERLRVRGRAVVLLGEARPILRTALGSLELPKVEAESMQEVVARAAALARPGDAVLLAPACASFDMFQGYAHRGRVFAEAVRALPEEAT